MARSTISLHEYFSALGKKGGKATLKRHGKAHYRRIRARVPKTARAKVNNSN